MTMPNERRNAVNRTMELLVNIVKGEYDCSEVLRDEARRCLKHYPSEYYMDLAKEQAPQVFGEWNGNV